MEQHVISVVLNVVASLLTLYLFILLFRPKLKICREIAFVVDDKGSVTYWFKIINKSWYSAFDVKFELFECYEIPANPTGRHVDVLRALPLTTSHYSHVPSILSNKTSSEFACQTRTLENLKAIYSKQFHFVQLQVTVRHGLTSLSRSYLLSYNTANCLKEGEFLFGNSLGIQK